MVKHWLIFLWGISLEQSNEIVYYFTCWYQKLRVTLIVIELKVTFNPITKSYFNSDWAGMVKYGYVPLGHRIQKSAITQLKYKSMNIADFLHAGCDGSFWLEHESCSLFLGFKYWGSTVVVLHCSYYLLRWLLSFGVPQSLSQGHYSWSILLSLS